MKIPTPSNHPCSTLTNYLALLQYPKFCSPTLHGSVFNGPEFDSLLDVPQVDCRVERAANQPYKKKNLVLDFKAIGDELPTT